MSTLSLKEQVLYGVISGRASFSQLMVLAISQVLIGQASTELGLDLAPAMEASTPGTTSHLLT